MDKRFSIGQSSTVTHGTQKLQVKLRDIGVSSSKPAALLEFDGNTSDIEIVKLGQSVTTSSKFVVGVAEIQNQGAVSSVVSLAS